MAFNESLVLVIFIAMKVSIAEDGRDSRELIILEYLEGMDAA